MIQRMKNSVTINVPDVDLSAVFDIQVTFKQKSTGLEFTYSGDDVFVASTHDLVVKIPKEDAMQFDSKNIRGQIMFMREEELPDATEIFVVNVRELLKEDGYGD